MNCAQVVLQIKLNSIFFISVSLEVYVSKYVNRFELFLYEIHLFEYIYNFYTRVVLFSNLGDGD